MGARAIIEWHQTDSGVPAFLRRNHWLSPSTFLPALADFVHAARQTGQTPDAGLFQSWAAEHAPYVLGEEETGKRTALLLPTSDIQFHYLVQLTGTKPAERTLLVTAREREVLLPGARGRWTVLVQAGTDAELHEEAAALLDRQAARIRSLAAQGRGGPMPPPHEVANRAQLIRARAGLPAPQCETVPQGVSPGKGK
ncbi:hypothetical protein [Streptomyces sp. NBC_01244]|uniref:hypothetical protein n=1 Tax=Streptomyces sp. NBC_01244 TaxID=2903797 RepID=UPI002E13B4AD|nr:hypothetical protein OG247_43995 [Streptomyces sp. NBC_01244]